MDSKKRGKQQDLTTVSVPECLPTQEISGIHPSPHMLTVGYTMVVHHVGER